MSIQLYEHNQTAYNSAVSMLEECNKAAVIHPTGTGKSYIAFKLCEENSDKRICWLSPSEYIFRTQIENVRKQTPDFDGRNIAFITYSKLMLMKETELAEIAPSYIVMDEFHRCGALEWGKGVKSLLNVFPDVPILGLSATAIRYLDNQRNMAEELFDGNIASEITLGEAIVRGILAPPTYVISMYSYQKELEKYEKKVKSNKYKAVKPKAEKYLESLRRALSMAEGIPEIFAKHMKNKNGKYIVFCASVEHLNEMIECSSEWFGKVDAKAHIYKTYSDIPEANADFTAFKTDNSEHLKLLYCVDMLNEGIHIEDISGVILLRPTISPIIYKQQIGRALSAARTTNPIIFDIVNNFENLYSISAIEEEMQISINYYRYLGQDETIVNEKFKIVDVVRDCKKLFNELEETLSSSWDEMYFYAKAYYNEHGNLDIPKRYKTQDGRALGMWLDTQRRVYNGTRYGHLDKNQIEKLDSLGMRWENVADISWNKFYSTAKKYYEANGNLSVNISFVTADGYPLGRRVSQIRIYRKSGIKHSYVTPERVAMLDDIGMIWSVPDYVWERNYMAALEYYREHGDLEVPEYYIGSNGVNLEVWLRNLRSLRKSDSPYFSLTKEQVQRLDELGMRWGNVYDKQWDDAYVEAEKYFEANGNIEVPTAYVSESGFKLGKWISRQREAFLKISPDRKDRLDKIGMRWEKPNSWEIRFGHAKKYYMEHGNLNIPPQYIVDGMWINKWVNEQKQIYHGKRTGKKLTKEQISRLESIGMVW